ncbi:Phosphatidylinositol N-acetyglucosaminlytransferase subunit P-related [Euphorbia peplus]|nr:Phosphatidylinositol N-acetyglucosaminlytransferase subunit P-related [Euphorbia peplus]
MSTKMESPDSVSSVMARLMGLDEMPIQRTVLKKPRVLSENYLRRVSSVGVRKKCSDQQSFKFSIEQQDDYKNVLQVLEKLSRKKHHARTVVDVKMGFGSSDIKRSNIIPKDMEMKCVGNVKCQSFQGSQDVHSNLPPGHLAMLNSSSASVFREIRKECSSFTRKCEIKFLSSPNKVQNGVGVYFSDECCTVDTSEFRRSIPNSRTVVKPNLGKKNEILIPPNRTLGTESVKPRFRKETTRVVGQSISTMSAIEPRSELSCSDYFANESAVFSDRKRQINFSGKSYTTSKAKKHISERWKTTKRVKIVEPAGRSESRSRSLNMRAESLENGGYMSDLESVNSMHIETSEQGFNHIDGLECRPEYNLSVGHYVVQDDQGNKLETGLSSMVTQCSRQSRKTLQEGSLKQNEAKEDGLTVNKYTIPKSPMRNSVSSNTGINAETQKSPSNYDKHTSESSICIFSEKQEDSSLHIRTAFHVQEMSNEFFEEDTVSSQCSCTDPESLISFEEAYQPSPNSVLDRIGKRGTLSSSDCFKSVNVSLHGLHMQLELLKANTSVESTMAVSSDDDNNREGSVNEYEEIQALMSPLRLEDSRDFSYLVDVLTEAGFQSRRKHVPKLPISYSVFETLEKKYGDQESWKRSERRLLFDRVNLGLGEILQPFKGSKTLTKSVSKRFRYSHGDEMMEEEVWALVVNEDEESRKESELMLRKDDRWMELGDEIQEIGREIEDSLIDELVADVY